MTKSAHNWVYRPCSSAEPVVVVDVDPGWYLLPYIWFAFHWLAMSHSCYNPIIYCYMNARFRSGFILVLHGVPGLQQLCCCIRHTPATLARNVGSSVALAGEMHNGIHGGRQHGGGALLSRKKARVRVRELTYNIVLNRFCFYFNLIF
ncbi:conserved hypothetical protein [Culex quinquefasciatus]|uniref:G-protein coupled receptors family 1 profile domain-containing protein n=1 Tax=Culex quinquefasciatus TaxID=7176 RepID=B0XB78_CULQU|nr:conserved hypothetical protein [Culex quinquefasciatus]|eukprot:XP_001866900.1 conserved hypothetical protein [Culex quinquefasciatus]